MKRRREEDEVYHSVGVETTSQDKSATHPPASTSSPLSDQSDQDENFSLPSSGCPEQSPLCTECKKIDIEGIFNMDAGKDIRANGIAVSGIRKTFSHHCSLCLIIKKIMAVELPCENFLQKQAKYGVYLRAFGSFRILRGFKKSTASKLKQSVILAVVPGKNPQRKISALQIRWALARGVIIQSGTKHIDPDLASSELQYSCRRLDADTINYRLLREWIYGAGKPEARLLNFQAYVIDCASHCLVPLTDDLRYLALSYVWGEAEDTNLSAWLRNRTSILPQHLPRTIADAVSVVISLKERYLWVDRYCIPGWTDKHVQIENMDRIYQGAIATIVDLANEGVPSSHSGLHGLTAPRNSQPRAYIGNKFVSTSFPHLSYYISISKWASRGWTLQEGALSGRCIFFTKDQIIFASKSGILCEGVRQCSYTEKQPRHCAPYIDGTPVPNLSSSLWGYQYHLSRSCGRSYSGNTHGTVDRYLAQYTTRSLSREEDIIFAFQGILRAQQLPSFWGLYCVESNSSAEYQFTSRERLDYAFRRSLLWSGLQHVKDDLCYRARRDFPSWSWASVDHQINYRRYEGMLTRCETDDTKIYVPAKPHLLSPLQPITNYLESAIASTTFVVNGSRHLVLDGICAKVRLKYGEYQIFSYEKFTSCWIAYFDTMPENQVSILGAVDIDSIDSEEMLGRLKSEEFDVVNVVDTPRPVYTYPSMWILLDWHNSIAKRIGIVSGWVHDCRCDLCAPILEKEEVSWKVKADRQRACCIEAFQNPKSVHGDSRFKRRQILLG